MTDILAKVSKNPAAVIGLLDDYDALIKTAEPVFELEGKSLVDLCRDHPKNVMFYKKKLGELKTLEEFFKKKADEISSKHWRQFNENHRRALGTKDIQQYIAGETDYVTQWELVMEIVVRRKQFEAIVEALSDMSWMLGHITKLRVAELEDAIL